jgi:hypothetical protein
MELKNLLARRSLRQPLELHLRTPSALEAARLERAAQKSNWTPTP